MGRERDEMKKEIVIWETGIPENLYFTSNYLSTRNFLLRFFFVFEVRTETAQTIEEEEKEIFVRSDEPFGWKTLHCCN
jgi:hypothetical protein